MPTLRDLAEDMDLVQPRESWIRKAVRDVSKQPAGKQLAVGGVTGWCAGFVSGRIGKAAAVTIGGSLLFLQVAHHQGYINVNWNKMNKDVKRELKRAKNEFSRKTNVDDILEEVKEFVQENVLLAGGFTAGFLIGLAS